MPRAESAVLKLIRCGGSPRGTMRRHGLVHYLPQASPVTSSEHVRIRSSASNSRVHRCTVRKLPYLVAVSATGGNRGGWPARGKFAAWAENERLNSSKTNHHKLSQTSCPGGWAAKGWLDPKWRLIKTSEQSFAIVTRTPPPLRRGSPTQPRETSPKGARVVV